MSRPRLSFLNIATAAVGIALLVFTVRQAGGWTTIAAGFAAVGWWFAAVVLLGAFRMVCRTRAWLICAAEPRLPFADAFRAWIASDAVGNLTPLGLLASEPTKILMARAKISTVSAVASVTIENLFYSASVCVMLLGGIWLFMRRAAVPEGLQEISELILVAVVIATMIAIWAIRTRLAVLSTFAPIVSRLAGKSHAPADAIREVEALIYAAPRWSAARLLRVAAWEGMFHVAAVTEVWLVLRLLVPHVTLAEAFLLETAGRFITVAFKFVPYRLGIDEAGSGAVAAVIGFSPATGVTLALIRRLRIIVLNAVGLVPLVNSAR